MYKKCVFFLIRIKEKYNKVGIDKLFENIKWLFLFGDVIFLLVIMI